MSTIGADTHQRRGGGWSARLAELHPRSFFLETWRQMDEEAAAEREARRSAGAGYDWRPLVVLCSGAVFLTVMEYFGGTRHWVSLALMMQVEADGDNLWQASRLSQYARLYEFCWWTGWRMLGYFALPAVVTWLLGQRVRDHGLSVEGLFRHAWLYGVCFAAVLPLIIAVSFTSEFSTYYPFYEQASRSWIDFIAWELLYAAQFFGLEFFFRGWWLGACKTMMGSHAIFAMIVPYCMIHFGKPWLEALGAVVAGVVLGTLAMKTRSIWSGVLIHVSVALTMDLAALVQTNGLPERLLPP